MKILGAGIGVWLLWNAAGVVAGGAIAAEAAVSIEPMGRPDSVRELLYARPFALAQPYAYDWTQERPEVSSGQVLVLAVDPEFARPRQTEVPVLFVGSTPAQLTNIGYASGHLIVIVPGAVDLTQAPIYFGSTELPERIDLLRGRLEMEAAQAGGMRAFPRERVAAARAAGGDTLRVAGIEELLLAIADLVEVYAPDEPEPVRIYRMAPQGR